MILVSTALVLIAALMLGGYWMQKQRSQQTQRMQAADVYQSYLRHTNPTPMAAETAPPAISPQAQAQATRNFLLTHPAVTPGPGFDMPGVQSTGKTIVDAMDHAQQL